MRPATVGGKVYIHKWQSRAEPRDILEGFTYLATVRPAKSNSLPVRGAGYEPSIAIVLESQRETSAFGGADRVVSLLSSSPFGVIMQRVYNNRIEDYH